MGMVDYMTHPLKTILLVVIMLLGSSQAGFAQDYDKGVRAFIAGDYPTALKEWRPLAEQGNVDAQWWLGGMYALGQGVIQDNVYAHIWYNIAASNGYEDAKAFRDALAKEMTPSQIEKAQRLARECMRKEYKGC